MTAKNGWPAARWRQCACGLLSSHTPSGTVWLPAR